MDIHDFPGDAIAKAISTAIDPTIPARRASAAAFPGDTPANRSQGPVGKTLPDAKFSQEQPVAQNLHRAATLIAVRQRGPTPTNQRSPVEVVTERSGAAIERLGRYITRPPIAQDRLEQRADGTLLLTLKTAWKDGTRAIVLEPDTLMARLCAAVPPPRFHMLRYYGILSSHSKHRSLIVPKPPRDDAERPPPAAGDQLALTFRDEDESGEDTPRRSRKRWAFRIRSVLAVPDEIADEA